LALNPIVATVLVIIGLFTLLRVAWDNIKSAFAAGTFNFLINAVNSVIAIMNQVIGFGNRLAGKPIGTGTFSFIPLQGVSSNISDDPALRAASPISPAGFSPVGGGASTSFGDINIDIDVQTTLDDAEQVADRILRELEAKVNDSLANISPG